MRDFKRTECSKFPFFDNSEKNPPLVALNLINWAHRNKLTTTDSMRESVCINSLHSIYLPFFSRKSSLLMVWTRLRLSLLELSAIVFMKCGKCFWCCSIGKILHNELKFDFPHLNRNVVIRRSPMALKTLPVPLKRNACAQWPTLQGNKSCLSQRKWPRKCHAQPKKKKWHHSAGERKLLGTTGRVISVTITSFLSSSISTPTDIFFSGRCHWPTHLPKIMISRSVRRVGVSQFGKEELGHLIAKRCEGSTCMALVVLGCS